MLCLKTPSRRTKTKGKYSHVGTLVSGRRITRGVKEAEEVLVEVEVKVEDAYALSLAQLQKQLQERAKKKESYLRNGARQDISIS